VPLIDRYRQTEIAFMKKCFIFFLITELYIYVILIFDHRTRALRFIASNNSVYALENLMKEIKTYSVKEKNIIPVRVNYKKLTQLPCLYASTNHNSKAATTSKIHSIIERKDLPDLAIHLERIIDRVVITGSNIISPQTIIRDVTFCNSIPRKIASVFSLYKNHSRHERFVQSRAIWVLSRVDSLSLVPTRCFFSRFSARKNSASTVVSVFLCATSATSLRGTDKIDFSLAVRCRRRLQRQQRHRQRRR